MKISYNGFWPGIDPQSNWFSHMFRDYYNDPTIEFSLNHTDSDIVISSVFSPPVETNALKIFFTGESHKTYHEDNDIFLGFEETNVQYGRFRLPLWYLYINWWNKDLDGAGYSLTQKSSKIRENFCSIIIGNPVQNRIDVARKLSEISPVHGYGAVFGNQYSGDKVELLKNYTFNIAFENVIQSGYVTEKLFEALLAGCIPIYWGSHEADLDFNPKRFIRYNESLNDIYVKIKKIAKSKQAKIEIVSEPMFDILPSLDNLYEFFDKKGLR
jgi:hypothetical protein